jgi:hypothetical protein
MQAKVRGGCLCRSVRYETKVEPGFSMICCCRQCQQITGTGHALQFALPKTKVTITGESKIYRMTADSGNTVSSAFCPNCGSPIFKTTSGHPDTVFFHAATLDDPSLFRPQTVVYLKSKQPWDCVDPNLKIL